MRIVVIIVVALMLVSGAGAGAFFYFHQTAEASVGPTAEHQTAKDQKKDERNSDVFVELDPLLLPIIGPDGITQTVSMVIAIEVANDEEATLVKHLSPRLKDAYIQDLYGVLSRRNAMPNGAINIGMIKARLNKISQTVLGAGVVKGVLLQVVQQHPV